MRWPWQRIETRASQPFTDAVVNALVAQAAGSATGDPSAIAALETAAGLWARAFAAAKMTPDNLITEAITPAFMALVARNLIRRGESVFYIEVDGGAPMLRPVGSWDVRGGQDEDDWFYRVDLFGPSGSTTRFVPSAGVCHFRYAIDPSRPWFGVSPLQWAWATGTLAGNLEQRLGEESGAPVGALMPIPADGGDGSGDDPLAALKADIASAKGRQLLVETTSGAWDQGKAAAPQKDWVQSRFGADPPQALAKLRSDAAMSVLSACGVPVSLATDGDGTSQRESWRRFVMGSVEPIARMVAHELAVKLDVPGLTFDFKSLWAHDLQGRAAMFKALVSGGVPVNEALAQAGLLDESDNE